jgi:hypothetical protein
MIEQDTTMLGRLLVLLGFITEEERLLALESQERSSLLRLFGRVCVEQALITEEQLDAALQIQSRLRSEDVTERALAHAELAHTSATDVVQVANRLQERTARLLQKTGEDYPAITPEMLEKSPA